MNSRSLGSYDFFLRCRAEDKTVLRSSAVRASNGKAGLNVWVDEEALSPMKIFESEC